MVKITMAALQLLDIADLILLGCLTILYQIESYKRSEMWNQNSFLDKVIVVTGAGSGVGRATAKAYAEAGARLGLFDINKENLDRTAAELRNTGSEVLALAGDVADPEYCHEAIETTVHQFKRLDALCNVAGIVSFRTIAEVDPSFWRKHFGVNVDGPFFLSQAALPHLIKTGGNIVNVASSAALVGEAYLVPYAASKAALVHMTKSMAIEHINDNVRINAVAPGAIDTDIMAGQSFPDNLNYDLVARYTGLRAASKPEEIAAFILYVSSPLAASIHGACLSVDGGISAG